MSQITKPAMRKAVMKAATGASARMTGETTVRGVSSKRMDASFPGDDDAQHFQAHGLLGPFPDGPERAQPAVVNDGHPVGHLEKLVQVLADHHYRAALAGE